MPQPLFSQEGARHFGVRRQTVFIQWRQEQTGSIMIRARAGMICARGRKPPGQEDLGLAADGSRRRQRFFLALMLTATFLSHFLALLLTAAFLSH